MMTWEKRLGDSIRKHILWWGFAAVLLLGAFIRYSFLPLLCADLEFMNSSWYNAIREGGMAAVFQPELQWTYSPMHLYVWALTYALLPNVSTLVALKAASLVMELGLIVFACLLVWRALPKERRPLGLFVAFTLLWLNPILILNAAGGGQTDASYAALSLLALWLLLKDKPAWAMVSLGLALAFKLQAVFLLPAFVIAYFCREKRFSVLWFLLVPGVWVLSGVPMALLGQSPLNAVTVYLGQTDLYTKPTFNCPNLFALLGDALSSKQMVQGMLQRYFLALCLAALGGMLVWMARRNARLTDRSMLLLGAWCVLTCVFFLPRMHERYGLVGEMLLLLWAIVQWKPRCFAYVLLGLLPTVSAYCEYMFRNPMFSLQCGAALNLVLLALLTWELVRAAKTDTPEVAA